MSDSSDIDNAVVAKLASDTTLLALMPDNVWFDEAPQNSKRFVKVTLIGSHDRRGLEERLIEEVIYAVIAVGLSSLNPNMKAAAARIDALLDDTTLTVPGYSTMAIHRFEDDPRIRTTEVDEVDSSIRWYHRGGHYRVVMST